MSSGNSERNERRSTRSIVRPPRLELRGQHTDVTPLHRAPSFKIHEIRLDRRATRIIKLRRNRVRIEGSEPQARGYFFGGMAQTALDEMVRRSPRNLKWSSIAVKELNEPVAGSFLELGNFIRAQRTSLINVNEGFSARCNAVWEIMRAFPNHRINVVVHARSLLQRVEAEIRSRNVGDCFLIASPQAAIRHDIVEQSAWSNSNDRPKIRIKKLFTTYFANAERAFYEDDLVIFWETNEILIGLNHILLSQSNAKFSIVGLSSQTDLWNKLSLGCQQLNIFGDRVFKFRSNRRYLPEMRVELKRFEISARRKRIKTTSDFRSEIWANEPRNQFIVSIVQQLVEELTPATGKQRRIAIVTDSIPHMKRLLGIIPNATLDESQMHLAEELEFVRPLIVGWSLPDPVRPFVVLSQDLNRVSHFRNGAIVWAAGGRAVAELPNSWLLHQSGEPVEMRIIDITDTYEGQSTRESLGRIEAYFRQGLGVEGRDHSWYRRGRAACYMTGGNNDKGKWCISRIFQS